MITVPPASGKYEVRKPTRRARRPHISIEKCGAALVGACVCLLSCLAVAGREHPQGVAIQMECRTFGVPPEVWLGVVVVVFSFDLGSPVGSGPYSEVVQYRDNPWLGRGKPLFHSPVPKISLIYELLNEQRIRY